MSQPLWIRADADVSVGTATIAAATDLLTMAGHGLDEGQPVVVSSLTGGAVGVLADGGVYYVRDVDTDTFGLARTLGGLAVDFSADGGADVALFEPGYDQAELRRADSALMTKDGPDRFGARSGIHPHNEPAVTVAGTTVTVEDITGEVYPGITDQDGPYRFAHPSESLSLDPADGSQDRLDVLDLQVQDDDADSSGRRRMRVVYTAGTPGSPPDLPAPVANALRLTRGGILVSAGGSPAPALQEPGALFSVAAGGILPVRDDSELPSNPYVGMLVERLSDHALLRWDGSAWRPVVGWTPIDSGTHSGAAFTIDATKGGIFPAGTFAMMRLHLYGDLDGDGTVRLRINDDNTPGMHQSGMITHDAASGAQTDVHANGAQWYLAEWATVTGCTATALLMRTGESDAVAYTCLGGRSDADGVDHVMSQSWGRINANRLVSSLNVRPFSAASNLFAELHWSLEGYRA